MHTQERNAKLNSKEGMNCAQSHLETEISFVFVCMSVGFSIGLLGDWG